MGNKEIFRSGSTPHDYAKWISVKLFLTSMIISITFIIGAIIDTLSGDSNLSLSRVVGPALMCYFFIFSVALYFYSRSRNFVRSFIFENMITIENGKMTIYHNISPSTKLLRNEVTLENISSITRFPPSKWNQLKDETGFFFKLFYLHPKPPENGLFVIFADPQDLMIIRLKEPVKTNNFNCSVTTLSSVKMYEVNEIIVSVDPERTFDFTNLLK